MFSRFGCALDLRVFLERLKGTNELRDIPAAHRDLEIGALSEIFADQPVSPALLFDDIPGHQRGYRVLSNVLFSPRREALALGIGSELSRLELVRWVKRRLENLKSIPPREISNGPVLQNVITGDAVDILKFPVSRWHELDGGRYIGTFDISARLTQLSAVIRTLDMSTSEPIGFRFMTAARSDCS